MSYYNITVVERQILINQYEILKKGCRNNDKVKYYESQIKYLTEGKIYLFEANNDYLEQLISKEESQLVMDILALHDVIIVSAQNNKLKNEKLLFDFNNDHPYAGFAESAIKSKIFPAYNDFKVVDSHGSKGIKDHKKQINWWKSNNKKPIFTKNELELVLDYHNLP